VEELEAARAQARQLAMDLYELQQRAEDDAAAALAAAAKAEARHRADPSGGGSSGNICRGRAPPHLLSLSPLAMCLGGARRIHSGFGRIAG